MAFYAFFSFFRPCHRVYGAAISSEQNVMAHAAHDQVLTALIGGWFGFGQGQINFGQAVLSISDNQIKEIMGMYQTVFCVHSGWAWVHACYRYSCFIDFIACIVSLLLLLKPPLRHGIHNHQRQQCECVFQKHILQRNNLGQ